jgi:integrase
MVKRNHESGKLAAIALKKYPDGWHADGGNLYLFVRGASRTWVFRYTAPNGQRRNMGLGSLNDVGLSRARDLAKQHKSALKDPANPIDPIDVAFTAKQMRRVETAKQMTFKQCARAFIESKKYEWKNAKHVQQWENTLVAYAYPTFGDLSVSDIDTGLVTKCLVDIWTSKTETATRVRGRIESVLDWAKVNEYRTGENPARWRGHLDKILPTPAKVSRVKHHPALPHREIGKFMIDLRLREGQGARALELTILTAARSGEIRGAQWSEINFAERLWIVPADRMKAGKEHRIPLSDAALKILQQLPRAQHSDLIFPSENSGKPISDMTISAVLKRMEVTGVTVHGFRSTFRDWCSDCTNYSNELAEMALAHTIKNSTEAAYRRSDVLERRRSMMKDWADYCGRVQLQANVISIDAGRR